MSEEAIVYIVDDDDEYRKAISRLLSAKGYRVIALASAEEFLAQKGYGHGCVLLDVRMPGMSGLQLQQQLVDRDDIPPIIFVTGHASIPMTVTAMKAGAENFLAKPAPTDVLISTINAALERSAARRQQQTDDVELHENFAQLTRREREVFERVIRGLLNKQIAFELGMTERTVRAHRQQVMHKMRSTNVQQLVSIAYKLGVVV